MNFLAAVVLIVMVSMAAARPSGVDVVYHDPHHEPSLLGSLSHVLKASSSLLHSTGSVTGVLGSFLQSSNPHYVHKHHHVLGHTPETVYVSPHIV